MKKLWRILVIGFAALSGLCLVLVGVSALSNMGLPTHSSLVDRLSELDKAHLEEVLRLRSQIGSTVWPGWGEADIPIIVYNESYAFLVGYPDPPAGWKKVPSGELRGGPWEAAPGELFQGQVYYRQRLTDPEITPEAFTVQVGERWAATLTTREFAQISLVRDFRQDLPGFLKAVFPYRLLWRLLLGDTETYLGALEHEAFHAYQGIAAPRRLAEGERTMDIEGQYPWENRAMQEAWQAELNKLSEAIHAETDAEAAALARQFLELRDGRREANRLSPQLVDLERKREWEEGLAKYAELEIQRQAALAKDYEPVGSLSNDPDFKNYATRLRYWENQLSEVKRMGNRNEDTRFYYSGFAQAVLLDRLMPGWKEEAFEPGVWVEDLLRQAVR